jgi:hypothetical protein
VKQGAPLRSLKCRHERVARHIPESIPGSRCRRSRPGLFADAATMGVQIAPEEKERSSLKRLLIGIIFAFVVMPFLLAASPAQARFRDNPNYGYCKSGHIVRDIKFCREFGGRR